MLCIDDEPDNNTILKQGLELNGFNVTVYNDSLRAAADYKPKQYDCHILDIRMHGMNGFELARQIWMLDPDAQICFLSAFEIFEDEARIVFKNSNTRCFVKKPIAPSELAKHLQRHMVAMG